VEILFPHSNPTDQIKIKRFFRYLAYYFVELILKWLITHDLFKWWLNLCEESMQGKHESKVCVKRIFFFNNPGKCVLCSRSVANLSEAENPPVTNRNTMQTTNTS
jgi:hypothetical protein